MQGSNKFRRIWDERQAKINELKDQTNYYNTQQLIQKYDPDPATKAAAASVLASKLGADSGLHWFVDESHINEHDTGEIGNVEFMQSGGLRRRNALEARSTGSTRASRDAFRHLFGTRAAIYFKSELFCYLLLKLV
ncbi:putative Lunapark family protein [Helianthus anomalus]